MEALSPAIIEKFRDRHAMLWLCQGYDLLEGQVRHDYSVPAETVSLLYRDTANAADKIFGNLYWEAIWIEGVRSPALQIVKSASKERQTVVLASSADATAVLSSEEFLPVSVLPGLLEGGSPDSRYGKLKHKQRMRVAEELASRLEQYPGRVLVVLGAREPSDLEMLYEALESSRIVDLRLFVIWPPQQKAPERPEAPVALELWKGSTEEFASALETAVVPAAAELPKWSILAGRRSLTFTARDTQRILKRFALITERDLIPPDVLTLEDLTSFLEGTLGNWRAISSKLLPVPRSFVTSKGSIFDELDSALKAVNSDILTKTIVLPSEPGAGCTTLLRALAHRAARNGYPTIILRPDQVEVDIDEVLAFAGVISEAMLKVGENEAPPIVIVADVEHEDIPALRKLMPALSQNRRKALFIKGISSVDNNSTERDGRYVRVLPTLKSDATDDDIVHCFNTFTLISEKSKLSGLSVPSLAQWYEYEKLMRYHGPDGAVESNSLFWVALRFFLLEAMPIAARGSAESALGEWIERRSSQFANTDAGKLLEYIAALSSIRLVAPLWTVLRPVYGGAFSTDLTDSLKRMDGIVLWGDAPAEISESTLRFAHPALASEFLRTLGIRTPEERIRALLPVVRNLSAGSTADMWLADALTSQVFVPGSEDRRSTADWQWRLDMFDSIPVAVRDQSQTVLHHWARCLYQSADAVTTPPMPLQERKQRYELAIAKLERALQMTGRPGRREVPSHLYNTLGVAHSRYAELLQSEGTALTANEQWDLAWESFQKSLDRDPANMDALFAFSRRLINRAKREQDGQSAALIQDVTHAMELLDDAQDGLDHHPSPDPAWDQDIAMMRSDCLHLVDAAGGLAYAKALQQSDKPAIGYVCEARLLLKDPNSQADIRKASAVLDGALADNIDIGERGLSLRLLLTRKSESECFDFVLQLELHERLEKLQRQSYRPIDKFRHAVLCYQLERFSEGKERFRKLREQFRVHTTQQPRIQDIWRDPQDPTQPREAAIKVTRVNTPWDGDGFVDAIDQSVPLRPRHFIPPAKINEVHPCGIRFIFTGPFAVPLRLMTGAFSYSP